MYALIKTILFAGAIAILSPLCVYASEIRLDSSKADVKIGEQFTIHVIVNSQDSLNAIEGSLVFSKDLLAVKEIRDGNSVVNFWIEKPHNTTHGNVYFSGITPGGWSGIHNLIFSVVFEAKKDGQASIMLSDIHALRNDGMGTREPLSVRNLSLLITQGDSKIRTESFIDTEPPEYFTPLVSTDSNLFDGKYSLIFSTQDKGSGISHYEIKEFRFKFLSFLFPWMSAESPYVLNDQSRKSTILIKAVDNYENERIVTLNPYYPLVWYDYLYSVVILGVVCLLSARAYVLLWRKK